MLIVGVIVAVAVRINENRRLHWAQRHYSVAELTKLGWRIETEKAREVVAVKRHRVNHLLNLLLSVFTLGLWLVIWLLLAVFGGEWRRAFTKPQENVVDLEPIKPKRLATDAVDRPRRQLKSKDS